MKPRRINLTPEQLKKSRDSALEKFQQLKPHIDSRKPANHQWTQEEVQKEIDFWSESAGPNTVIVAALKTYLHQMQATTPAIDELMKVFKRICTYPDGGFPMKYRMSDRNQKAYDDAMQELKQLRK